MIIENILVEHIHQQLYSGYTKTACDPIYQRINQKRTQQIKSRTIKATRRKKSRNPVAHHQPDFDKRKMTATENEMLKGENNKSRTSSARLRQT
jgi:hypothetical protein